MHRCIACSFSVVLILFLVQSGQAKKKPPLHPVNLNTASSSELQLVPGIGPSTADKILQMRKSYGTFKSVDDLLAIRGIGPKKLEKMRRYLTVTKPSPTKAGNTHAPPKSPLANEKAQSKPVANPAAKPVAKTPPPKQPEASEAEEP